MCAAGLGRDGPGWKGEESLGLAGTHMGPLMIRAMSTLTSATNSCRSGYGSSTSRQLAGAGSSGEGASRALWALPSQCSPHTAPPSTPHTRLLLIGFPAGVDMHHALHHAQTQAQVPRHGAWLTVLIGVLLQRGGVHRGICGAGRAESRFFRTICCPAQRPRRGGELLPLLPPTVEEAGMSLVGGQGVRSRQGGDSWGVGDIGVLGAEQGREGGSHQRTQGCRGPARRSVSPEASQRAAAGTGGWWGRNSAGRGPCTSPG